MGASSISSKPVADDFHTYAVDWQPNKIIWYLDGDAILHRNTG